MMASGEIRLSTTTMRRMPVLAQSGGCVGSPCLDEIEVDAPHVLVPNQTFLPADLSSGFSCGSFQCSYQMGQFQSGVYRGVWINVNVLGKTGNASWVQTYFNSVTGQFQADWDNSSGTPYPVYPSYASSSNYFFDDPAGVLGSGAAPI
jgi:hypothetical protein